ncbi:MAG: aminopeptidase P family protein [Synergistaceae bacterium]|nr:aminopeptidase P family protein [Synergistaceae bacterium]
MAFETIERRLAKLRGLMAEKGMNAFILLVLEGTNSESCHYISGFRGSSAALVIDAKEATLVTDGRYRTQAAAQSPFRLVVQSDMPLASWVAKAVSDAGWGTVGFEADKISHRMFQLSFEPVKTRWVDATDFIPGLRRCKDEPEVEAIKRAARIGRDAYGRMLERAKVGMTEAEFDSALLAEIKRMGAERGWANADFIVVSGVRGAMCHGRSSSKAFGEGDTVTVDYGAMVDGYMSDITRNFAVGHAQEKARELNSILLRAHRAAAAALRPGVTGKDADTVARKIITDAGYGRDFVHGLGHGLGLSIHEAPRLSQTSKDILQVGDVVTVEPGIYIEGWGGLRIEDDYLITEDGAECLTVNDNQSLEVIS